MFSNCLAKLELLLILCASILVFYSRFNLFSSYRSTSLLAVKNCIQLCGLLFVAVYILFMMMKFFFAYAVQKIKQNERFFTVEFTREIFRMQEGSPNGANSVKRRKIVSN